MGRGRASQRRAERLVLDDEAVTDPDDGLDVVRAMKVVAKLPAQTGDVPRDAVGSDRERASANGISQVSERHHIPGADDEGVKEHMFVACQMDLALTLEDVSR